MTLSPNVAAGAMTVSGLLVTPDTGVPSLPDIAYSLARIPRFTGHTRRPWSVLDHSLFVTELASRVLDERAVNDPHLRRMVFVSCLLHDAHESLTSDVSTHFKTPDLRELQDVLDDRIMDVYLPGGATEYAEEYASYVKEFDARALLAEALVVGPPKLTTPEIVAHYFGEEPNPEDVQHLKVALAEGVIGVQPWSPHAPQEQIFLRMLRDFLSPQFVGHR